MAPGTRRYLTIGLGLPLCALIFLADLALPLGVAIWLGYLAVVALAAWSGDRPMTLVLAGVSTLLIVAGFFLSRLGLTPWIAAVNRGAGIALVWAAAFLISSRRLLYSQLERQAEVLAAANAQLELQAEELTAANERLQEQAGQLQEADELLQDQAEALEVQAEELQAQNEELATLTDSLEQTVQERTAELRQANQSLQAVPARLIAVQENERRAISREVHDESGQLLTALTIRLGLLRQLWEQGEFPLSAIDELKQIADQLAEGLHRLAVNLRPPSLDRAGLVVAVEQYIASYRKTYGIEVELVVLGLGADRLAPEMESSLYRIIQEALTNVARHAGAHHVAVVLNRRSGTYTAVIEDDGVGFDVEAAARAGRLGLAGMKERAELRGGSLAIDSQPGAGTTVFVEIPCPPELPVSPGNDPAAAL